MKEIVLCDLFCGAGGSAVGYHRAFEKAGVPHRIIGVDHRPQPRYPFEFVLADAMTFPLDGFDAVHASPPCQGYSIMYNLPWIRGRAYPLLLLPTIERLEAHGTPYVVENVMGARHGAKGLTKRGLEVHGLKAGWLCGTMFGCEFYRHRLFGTNWFWLQPGHPKHRLNKHPRAECYVYGGTVKGLPGGSAGLDTKPRHPHPVNTKWREGHDGNGAQRNGAGVGHAKGWRHAAELMAIDWMRREELTQAIPPAFTEYIGGCLIEVLRENAA